MNEAEIEAFVRSFEAGSVPRSERTHGKHLLMALWYLWRHGRGEATGRIREGIRRYNHRLGNTDGYHETITLAWIAVIDRFLDGRGRIRPIADLAGELLDTCGDKDFLSRHYSGDVLQSEEARHRWVPPDKSPFL
jgi:hypothetical protein